MRIVLYSDLQLHPYEAFSRKENGVNNRLLDHFNVLEQIREYCFKHEIRHLLFGGDMFEIRGSVNVIAAKMLAEWKQKVSENGIHQIDCVGNHDLVDKSTLHNSIEIYRHINNQFVITQPQWVNLGEGRAVYVIPFQHKLEDMQQALVSKPPFVHDPDKSIAIIHYGLYDVPMETMQVIKDIGHDTEGQIRAGELEPLLKYVKHVFFGHYHITLDVTDRIHFIGTPLQHNWRERRVDTRFLDIDLDAGTFKGIPTVAPRFYEWQHPEDIKLKKVVGNFCRVNECRDQEQRTQIIELFKIAGARGADAFIAKKTTQNESRLKLNLAMSFEEMGCRMVDADTTLLDKDRLKKVFSELLTNTVK